MPQLLILNTRRSIPRCTEADRIGHSVLLQLPMEDKVTNNALECDRKGDLILLTCPSGVISIVISLLFAP
ncbi:hypothetical protein BDV38DRAFT_242900 [Aspergillus pseudotamarii]|uniref:Uncharacterized protein n=1 Tax=Aspergillus pseudotamarii TaxID=132259 RepID=A0A5N6SZ26_ASPPS|nr:uncharacterized protein BDV38DRAFT_242900 [Aspergillus pseudotamarii]KAE8139157.1 hypothetical protein BDV38DRAFT_242900 [Aspergillus pseudotamarii]